MTLSAMRQAPYKEGEIVLMGTPVPMKLELVEREDGFSLISKVEGEPYEEERYQLDETSLRFKGTDVESFDPPIPLVTLPFHSPDQWTWSGKMTIAGKTFGASAEASSETESLNVPGGPYEASKVTLDLAMKDPTGSVGKRKLIFWLDNSEGIIKREFAQSSTRQPVSEPEE